MRKAIIFVLIAGTALGLYMGCALLTPLVMNEPFCTAPDSCADSSHVRMERK